MSCYLLLMVWCVLLNKDANFYSSRARTGSARGRENCVAALSFFPA